MNDYYQKKRSFSDGKVPFSNGNLNSAMELATEYRCRVFGRRCPVSKGKL